MKINKELVERLLGEARENARLRQNLDLRTSGEDGSQRMLNALMPGTVVAVHRHPMSNENVIILCGSMDEVIYEASPEGMELVETRRIHLDPTIGNYGCVVPAGAWHTVEVLEPTVIYEAKDGKYGEDGSEVWRK